MSESTAASQRHLAFAVQPAYGHVIPTLPLVRELVDRGWRVSYATGPDLVPLAEKAGATGVEVPTELPPVAPPRANFSTEGFADLAQHSLDDARRHFPVLHDHFVQDPPAAVCYDMLTFTGQMLVDTLDAPGISLVPTFAAHERFPLATALMGDDFGAEDSRMAAIAAERSAFAAGYGVTRSLNALGGEAVADLNIVFLPRQFQLSPDVFDGDPRFRFIGPTVAEPPTEQPAPDPIVYVSLGTAFNADPAFYRMCFEALRDSTWQVVMAVGRRIDAEALGPPPPNIMVTDFADQHQELRRARVHISHAGMNSTMESMVFGVPMVAIPQMPEQEGNAARAADLGVAYVADRAGLTAEKLRGLVDGIDADARVQDNLRVMREAIRGSGGVVAGADAIEAHVLRADD